MKRLLQALSLAVIVGMLFGMVGTTEFCHNLENYLYDTRMYMKNTELLQQDVILVQVEPNHYSELMAFLKDLPIHDVAAIGLDLPAMYPAYQRELQYLSQTRKLPLVLSSGFMLRQPAQAWQPYRYMKHSSALQQAFQVGFANYVPDRDGVIRQLPVRMPYRTQQSDVPQDAFSFSWQLYQKSEQALPYSASHHLFIHYGGPENTYPRQSFYEFKIKPQSHIKRKILIFADLKTVAPYRTPFSTSMSLLELHAHSLSSLLTHKFYVRPALLNYHLPLLLSLVGGLLMWGGLRWSMGGAWLLMGALGALFVTGNQMLFLYRYVWLDLFAPSTALLASSAALSVHFHWTEGRQRQQLRNMFYRYLPAKTVQALLQEEATSLTQNERRIVTIMFTDINGFSKMSEQLPPDQIIRILNEYMTAMTEIIFANHGTLDKYVGDGIMAVYGNIGKNNPKEDAYRAVKTAIEMQVEMQRLQNKWMHEGLRPIQIRIGINTGDALVGYVGHPNRKELTVIGDTVNTSSRLEELNKKYHTSILISQSTYEQVRDLVQIHTLGEERLKGKSSMIVVHEVKGWKGRSGT